MPNRFVDLFNETDKDRIIDVDVEKIVPSPYQPRIVFDDLELQELAASIHQNGLIQPITVRKVEDHYEIIAGERRYRACRKLEMEKIPCYVLTPNEDQAAQMALVENIQRKDLTAIEEAKSYLMIMRQCHMTQEQLAEKIGKSQSSVANKIRLLNLPEDIQGGVLNGEITERHARALLWAPADQQKKIYQEIIKKNLNVKQTEELIEKNGAQKKRKKKQTTKGFSRNVRIAVNTVEQSVRMIEKLGISVSMETEQKEDEIRVIIHLPNQ